MRLQGDQIALFLSGQDVPVPECNIIIHQPTIKQIVLFKESDFLSAIGLWGNIHSNAQKVKEQNESANDFDDFQIALAIASQDKTFQKVTESFFQLIFPQYEVIINEHDISFFHDDKRVGMINQFNYESFETAVKNLFSIQDESKSYKPANEKAKKIAEKLEKRAKMLAESKGKQDESPSLYGSYTSILSLGMNMDINILFTYTPFQLSDAFNRYWKKANSDFYQRVSTMPMMDTSKMEEPSQWTENLYNQ